MGLARSSRSQSNVTLNTFREDHHKIGYGHIIVNCHQTNLITDVLTGFRIQKTDIYNRTY